MLLQLVQTINAYLSDYVLVILLIVVGLWYTIRTGFVQIRFFSEGVKTVFGNISLNGKKHESGMSSFQALATAIAAQVGTGNIVGASGAILTGGPGAIFWMWVIAFFGMATIYAEAVLAQKTRIKHKDGSILGGPVYYITTAFKGSFGRFLAGFFAVAIILALGFFGCMVQSNSIGSTFQTAFGVPSWIVGVVLVVICAVIFIGGMNRLASVTEKIVPIMAVIFIIGGIVVLAARITYIPATFAMIFRYAFTPQAIIGGSFGMALKTAVSQGAKRGLFSNEGQTRPLLQRSRHGFHSARARAGKCKKPSRAGRRRHGRRLHRYFYCSDTERAGHHLHALHGRRRTRKRLFREQRQCGGRSDRKIQPGTDRLQHGIRPGFRKRFRRGLPVLLCLLHCP